MYTHAVAEETQLVGQFALVQAQDLSVERQSSSAIHNNIILFRGGKEQNEHKKKMKLSYRSAI